MFSSIARALTLVAALLASPASANCGSAAYGYCCDYGRVCDCNKGVISAGQCGGTAYAYCCQTGTPCNCKQPPLSFLEAVTGLKKAVRGALLRGTDTMSSLASPSTDKEVGNFAEVLVQPEHVKQPVLSEASPRALR
jgi:hypothetical protein